MKITVETSALSRELFKITGVIPSKSTQPVLHNALLEVDDEGTLTLKATDYDISIRTSIGCEVSVPGRVAIRGRDLYDAVKNIKSPTLTLEREENGWVHLTAGSVRARLVGMDPDEFPTLPAVDSLDWVDVDTRKLMHMVERTLFSVSTDEGRPNLTGALLRLEGEGSALMVSTDGHRLSRVRTRALPADVEPPPALVEGIIVPRKGLSELQRSVDRTLATVSLGLSGNSACFRFGATHLIIRLIDGTFPNFQQVIPEEREERRATVQRAELVDRIRFVSLFSNTKTYSLRLELEDETCIIRAQDPDKGECEERVAIQYAGAPVKAGFNYRYLLDVLNTIAGEEVSMEVVDTLSPTILRELEGDDGDDALFIVMPMRI